MEGVDYSFSRPTPSTLKAVGKHFAVRYVGTPLSQKSLTVTEVSKLNAAEVDIVATYETEAGFMLRENGRNAAFAALNHALAMGMPSHRPIYFALDVDPRSLSDADKVRVRKFLDDAALAIGRRRVGIYGGYTAMQLYVGSSAAYGWQTYAWSGGALHPRAHLYQYKNGVALAGGTVDLCRSLAPDFGQWSYQPLPTQKEDDDMAFMVQSEETGAVLLVTGGVSLLIVSNDERVAHETAGIPRVLVGAEQFKRYVGLRADVPRPPVANIVIDAVDLGTALAEALHNLSIRSTFDAGG